MRLKGLVSLIFIINIWLGTNQNATALAQPRLSNHLQNIDSLYALTESLLKDNPSKALRIATEVNERAKQTGNFETLAKSSLMLANTQRALLNYKGVLKTLTPILPYLQKISDDNLKSEILNNIGIAHYQLGHDTLSLSNFLDNMAENSDEKSILTLSESLKSIGSFYYSIKNFNRAKDFFSKSATVDSLAKSTNNIGISLFWLGKVYAQSNQTEMADYYLVASLDYLHDSLKLEVNTLLSSIRLNINPELALVAIEKALTSKYIENKPEIEAKLYLDKARALLNLNQLEEALSIFKKHKNNQFLTTEDIAQTVLAFANKHHSTGNTSKAVELYKQLVSPAFKNVSASVKLSALKSLAQIAKLLNNKTDEANYLWKYTKLTDSIWFANNEDSIYQTNKHFNIQKLEQRIQSYQKDAKIQNLLVESEKGKKQNLIILVSVLIPLLIVVILLYKQLAKANAKLSQQNQQINQQNEELSAINNLLSSSQDKLYRLNQTKDKLFSIIGHDLKSPLIAIKTLVNEDEETLTSKKAKYISTTLTEQINLLNNILFWALSQDDSIEYNPQEFSIIDEVQSELNVAKMISEQKNIDLSVSIDKSIRIYTDHNMFLFIVRNLLSNAIRYTPSLGKVTINAKKLNERTILEVQDTGVGIEKERIKNIFKAETFTSKKHKRDEEGTGLGLVLCKEFADKMNAELSVKSEENKGSTFTLAIPN
ncbi:MAG TPA: HAMP domain-containing sensor histidine kinase [Tenuifilaceae bacterium]|nr:HAMP domain-containing sensor histidine kinase [Tenuifilaceae bacterium]